MAEYLLDAGAVIDRSVPGAAVQAKSLEVFELLVRFGWDVNEPVVRGERALSCVMWFFLDLGFRSDWFFVSRWKLGALITDLGFFFFLQKRFG